MNIIFFGNTTYSTIVEREIYNQYGLCAVVTIPDQPTGRKKHLTPTPVKLFATKHNIPVLLSRKLDQSIILQIQQYKPDFLIVADYGLILPESLLKVPKFAPLNVHHSLLPKFRGPAPAPAAILSGEKTTGVTIIQMTAAVDRGDILKQRTYTLSPTETTESLLIKLNTLGAKLLPSVIEGYAQQTINPKQQDHKKATYTAYITRQDGYIDIKTPPSLQKLDRMIRAYYPWPNVWTTVRLNTQEMRLKFLPGNMVQLEGKTPVTPPTLLRGYPELTQQLQQVFALFD